MAKKHVDMYTDGACMGNPGPGGWACLLVWNDHEKELVGGEPDTTNNRMELMACIKGLSALVGTCSVDIWSDSQYVVKGMTEWMPAWQRRNFKRVKNPDLWKQLVDMADLHEVTWHWVRGHSGHPENERADDLARAEAERQQEAVEQGLPPWA